MSPRDFCYWLRGFIEINDKNENYDILGEGLTPAQLKIVQDHLDKIFNNPENVGELLCDLKQYPIKFIDGVAVVNVEWNHI